MRKMTIGIAVFTIGILLLGGIESVKASQEAFKEAEAVRQVDEIASKWCTEPDKTPEIVDRCFSHEEDVSFEFPVGNFIIGFDAILQAHLGWLSGFVGDEVIPTDRDITVSGNEASLFAHWRYRRKSYTGVYSDRYRKEDGVWVIYKEVPRKDTLAPDDEKELRRIISKIAKPAFEKKEVAFLEDVISKDVAFINSKGERTEGWDSAKDVLSAELDVLQPTLENVTIYLDFIDKEAFAFDEEDADLKTSFWLRKIDDAWKLTLIDFTGKKEFPTDVEPKGKLATTWGEIKKQ